MKIAVLIARVLLGLLFLVFGLNFFLHFIPMKPMTGAAGQFTGAMFVSHYLLVIGAVQVLGGALLLAGRYVPLALTILGPIVINIVLFHFLMAPEGIPVALVTALLWIIVFYGYRAAFAGIFSHRTIA